jgi:hypothetical protein
MENIPIRYVGKKPEETDHTYGTGLTWTQEDNVKDVPADKAALLLNHPDVWADARAAKEQKKDPVKPVEPPKKMGRDEPIMTPDMRNMDEAAVRHWAKVNLQRELPEGVPLVELKSRAMTMLSLEEGH